MANKLFPGFPLLLGVHLCTTSIINSIVYQGPCLLFCYSWKWLELCHQSFTDLSYFKVSYFSYRWPRNVAPWNTEWGQEYFPLCQILLMTWYNFVHSRWQPSMKWVSMPWRTLWPADQPRGWSPLLKVSSDLPQMTNSALLDAEAEILFSVKARLCIKLQQRPSQTLSC